MARTPYQDPEAEKIYQDISGASSQPTSDQGKVNDMTDNYMDNRDMGRWKDRDAREDWVREKDSEIQGQRNKRRNK